MRDKGRIHMTFESHIRYSPSAFILEAKGREYLLAFLKSCLGTPVPPHSKQQRRFSLSLKPLLFSLVS
jgi:hypothetical protein